MNEKNVKVQVIGNYLEALEWTLRYHGILFENIISVCNPLAMQGDIIDDNLKFCNGIVNQPTLLNLRKNLSQMLSHNAESFCPNLNAQPFGKEVRYKNTSEYLILMNTSLGYTLYEKDNVVYSDTYPQNTFTSYIKDNKDYRPLRFPFHESFNWKYYYDKFIDAVLHEFDNKHIILIKTNAAQWYMDNGEIKNFDVSSSQYRNMVEQLDEYFIERTGCFCIDEQYAHIPDKKVNVAFPFAMSTEFAYKQYERAIIDIINKKHTDYYRPFAAKGSPLEQTFIKRLSSDFIQEHSDCINIIHDTWLSIDDVCNDFSEHDDVFFNTITKLSEFLDPKRKYTLSDYAIKLLVEKNTLNEKIDLELISAYAKNMKLDINDVIAIYMLYFGYDKKEEFREIISNIINNHDCLPIDHAVRFKQNNINFLKDYPYVKFELKQEQGNNKIYVPIECNNYIVFDKTNASIYKFDAGIKSSFDYMSVIDNGYICSVEYANALCSNLAFYIEKARRGDGNTPIRLEYDSEDVFFETLNYIDYVDILESEKFIICSNNDNCHFENYSARCDLSFFFKDNVKIFYFANGLNDQIKFYYFAKALQAQNGGEIYFDNLFSSVINRFFNGNDEIVHILKEDIRLKLFSEVFSKKLLEYFCINRNISVPKLLYQNGLKELVLYSNDEAFCQQNSFNSFLFKCEGEFNKEHLSEILNCHPAYYKFWIQLYNFPQKGNLDLSTYIDFPDFDERNSEIAYKMRSCDAVVIHFRRGDYIQHVLKNGGASDEGYCDYSFYSNAIKNLLQIDDYPNKKYFVFSDDIKWVKANTGKVGLDQVPPEDVFYIDHNKSEDSFRDLQLMLNAKIMIISLSGFAITAAVLNTNCEILSCLRAAAKKQLILLGKQYKYDLDNMKTQPTALPSSNSQPAPEPQNNAGGG